MRGTQDAAPRSKSHRRERRLTLESCSTHRTPAAASCTRTLPLWAHRPAAGAAKVSWVRVGRDARVGADAHRIQTAYVKPASRTGAADGTVQLQRQRANRARGAARQKLPGTGYGAGPTGHFSQNGALRAPWARPGRDNTSYETAVRVGSRWRPRVRKSGRTTAVCRPRCAAFRRAAASRDARGSRRSTLLRCGAHAPRATAPCAAQRAYSTGESRSFCASDMPRARACPLVAAAPGCRRAALCAFGFADPAHSPL